jgi:transcriptional regulator GlxA family with amidase domain
VYTIDARYGAIQKYVYDNIDKHITVGELAAVVEMTGRSFTKYFKRLTQQSVARFIHSCKIKKASYLLRATDMSLDAIAMECGLCDRHYLGKIFSRIKEVTPAQYRKAFFHSENYVHCNPALRATTDY